MILLGSLNQSKYILNNQRPVSVDPRSLYQDSKPHNNKFLMSAVQLLGLSSIYHITIIIIIIIIIILLFLFVSLILLGSAVTMFIGCNSYTYRTHMVGCSVLLLNLPWWIAPFLGYVMFQGLLIFAGCRCYYYYYHYYYYYYWKYLQICVQIDHVNVCVNIS